MDDLLDVSRITQGKIKLRLEPVSLASVVSEAVETSRPVIDMNHHELVVVMPERDVSIHGDRARVMQIIANLLNNAAKYQNEHGHIELRVTADDASAVITVKDRGIGMSPEVLAEVFELFAQGERAPDRAQGGLGIGLSLVKNLAEMHGGSVEARSDGPGLGSEFVVRLPKLLMEMPGVTIERYDTGAPSPSRAARRILVVDDNEDAAESLAFLLRRDGHDVMIANDGVMALEMTAREHPAVVLLDIGLPGMDGYEVCRRIRAQGLVDAQVIAMTGYGQERDKQRSREAGFDTHTVKPVRTRRADATPRDAVGPRPRRGAAIRCHSGTSTSRASGCPFNQ